MKKTDKFYAVLEKIALAVALILVFMLFFSISPLNQKKVETLINRKAVVVGEVVNEELNGRCTYEVFYYKCRVDGKDRLVRVNVNLFNKDMFPMDTFYIVYNRIVYTARYIPMVSNRDSIDEEIVKVITK